jgi:hypothetical protein
MNVFMILAIIVLGYVALDVVDLILIMQLRMGLEDVLVAQVIVLPPMQVKEDAPSIVPANYHFFSY